MVVAVLDSLLFLLEKSFVYLLLPIIVLESLTKTLVLKSTNEWITLKESLTNITMSLMGRTLRALFTGKIVLAVLLAVSPFAFFHIPVTLGSFLLTIFVTDFVYYWEHRLSHSIRYFWIYHTVHHSSEQFNLSTAIRFPWFGQVSHAAFYVPLVLLGFDPIALIAAISLGLFYQFWVHTQNVGSLGVLDLIFNTPANHRVHHAVNPQYIDKNFGGIFIWWDILFNTYESEGEKVRYGVTKPIKSNNPFVVNLYEMYALARDVVERKGWRAKMMAFVRY